MKKTTKIKLALVIAALMLIATLGIAYAAEYVQTQVIFNIESNPGFTVTVGGANYTSNPTSPGTSAGTVTFTSISGEDPNKVPDAGNPALKYYNTGNEDLGFDLRLDSSLAATCITLKGNTLNVPGGAATLTNSWINVFSLLHGAGPQEYYLWADFSSCGAADDTTRMLYTNASIS